MHRPTRSTRLLNSQLSTTPLERRLIWVCREKQELTAFTKPLQSYSVTWHSVGCCSEALSLMSDWPPHLLILDTLEGPTPFTWDTFLGQGLPAVDPYRSGGPWYQEDDTPRVLPVLFLTADIPGPTDLPPAWQHRVHCQPRYHITHLLQAWLEKPLNPPRLQPEPLLIIDFRRHVLWVQGVSLTPPTPNHGSIGRPRQTSSPVSNGHRHRPGNARANGVAYC